MRALVVPADPQEPTRVIDLNDAATRSETMREAINSPLLEVQSHDNLDIWLSDTGRIDGEPLNDRVSHWVLNDSPAAKEGQIGPYGDYWACYGDCVITGPPDECGEVTPVRPEVVEMFEGMSIDPRSMDDWRMGQDMPPIIVTEWPGQGLDDGMEL